MRFKPFIVAAVVLLAVYAGWEMMYPSGTWRYKLTLVVDDNGRQVIGSSVVQVHMQVNPRITPETGDSFSVKGEAIAVDLGAKGTLFSLLMQEGNVDYGYYIVTEVFPPPQEVSDSRDFLRYYDHLKGKKKLLMPGEEPNTGELTPKQKKYYQGIYGQDEIKAGQIPMLVRFRDINDPKTVEKVDPNDLAKSFGPGVKLVSATIEMTDEGVTRGIVEKLPWLKKIKGGYLDGQFAGGGPDLANILHGGNFEMGDR